MSMEQPNLDSERINDKDLAKKMAYAGDRHRTFAAENRARAKSLESPKTIIAKINKWKEGRKAEEQARRLRIVANADDKIADENEDDVIFRHELQKEIRDLNDEELERLIDDAHDNLWIVEEEIKNYHINSIDNMGIGAVDINELKEKTEYLERRLEALSKMLIFKQSINQARSRLK